MMYFLKKIRLRFLSENKLNNYFLYAIGEIVLVVIGILFAVQIGEWNTASQRNNSNKIYLTKIIEELHLNKERLDFLTFKNNKNSLEVLVSNCDSLLKLMARGLEEGDVDFIQTTKFNDGGPQLNLYDTTYEELLNTGKLYTLGSDNVISAIKRYYKRYAREVNYNKRFTDILISGFKLMDTSLIKLRLDYEFGAASFNIRNYPWFFQPKSDKYISFQLGINRMYLSQQLFLSQCKELKMESEKLIVILEKELNEQK